MSLRCLEGTDLLKHPHSTHVRYGAIVPDMLVLVGVLGLLQLARADIPIDIRTCEGVGQSHVDIQSVTASEYPVTAGDRESFKVTFTSDISISSGDVKIDIVKFGRVLFSEKVDLCSRDTGVNCPVKADEKQTAVVTQRIPQEAPAVRATARISLEDGTESLLGCFEADVQVVKSGNGASFVSPVAVDMQDDEDAVSELGTELRKSLEEGDGSVASTSWALRGALSQTARV